MVYKPTEVNKFYPIKMSIISQSAEAVDKTIPSDNFTAVNETKIDDIKPSVNDTSGPESNTKDKKLPGDILLRISAELKNSLRSLLLLDTYLKEFVAVEATTSKSELVQTLIKGKSKNYVEFMPLAVQFIIGSLKDIKLAEKFEFPEDYMKLTKEERHAFWNDRATEEELKAKNKK